jgi:hypothetical protein
LKLTSNRREDGLVQGHCQGRPGPWHGVPCNFTYFRSCSLRLGGFHDFLREKQFSYFLFISEETLSQNCRMSLLERPISDSQNLEIKITVLNTTFGIHI